jgi:glycosyltransferase involved in cell wall biosynthesis
LQRAFDVSLVAFSRRNHQPNLQAQDSAAAALRVALTEVYPPISLVSEWSRPRKAMIHASSVVTWKPYIFFEYGNKRFGSEIQAALRNAAPDLVHLDSLDLYRWRAMLPNVPTTCTHHSIESELLRHRARHIGNPLAAVYLRHQANLLERIERRVCGQFDVNVMTSALDSDRLRALVPDARTTAVPNGVDVDFFKPTTANNEIDGRVVFLGPTYMFPNRDGVEFFLDSIWPSVVKHVPDASFHLLGKNSEADKMVFEKRPGVSCQGYVPDIRPHFAAAQCSVVPLRVGGGTRLKILDAWSMGKAVVSTSIGCEGLETVDGRNILIRDDAKGFADAVVQILSDAELRKRLGSEGRSTVENHYAWPIIGNRLSSLYMELIERRVSGPMGA